MVLQIDCDSKIKELKLKVAVIQNANTALEEEISDVK